MPDSRHGNHLGIRNYITFYVFPSFPPPPPTAQLRGREQWKEGVAERAGMVKKTSLRTETGLLCNLNMHYKCSLNRYFLLSIFFKNLIIFKIYIIVAVKVGGGELQFLG